MIWNAGSFEFLGGNLLQEAQHLVERHDVTLHHVERIAAHLHVQLGDVSPGAADRVEGTPFALGEDFRRLDVFLCKSRSL